MRVHPTAKDRDRDDASADGNAFANAARRGRGASS
jgi:hypothetical protein